MEPLLIITRPDGLRFTATWWPVKGIFAGRISGEVVITAEWGDVCQWHRAVQLYIEKSDLERKTRAAIAEFERDIRGGKLDA